MHIGGDFEGFVKSNDQWISAGEVLGGTKSRAISLGHNTVAHPDNIMAEFALEKPVPVDQFAQRVRESQDLVSNYISPATFHARSSVTLTEEWLGNAYNSNEIGCDPDYDYDGNMYMYSPHDIGNNRFAGFHLHFDVGPMWEPSLAVRFIDCTIGLASIAHGWDSDQGARRGYYGSPGRHRVKPYGVEYRTLSSNVLNHLDELQAYLPLVVRTLQDMNHPVLGILGEHHMVAQCISEQDITLSKILIKEVDRHV